MATVLGAGVCAGWVYKRTQVLIVHPGIWPLYPLSDVAAYLFLWPILFLAAWALLLRLANRIDPAPGIPVSAAAAAPFLPFVLLPWVGPDTPTPGLFQAAVVAALVL